MTLQIIDTAKASPVKPAIQSLEKLYTFRRPAEISEYIDALPFLVPLLVEAYDKIGEYFGPQPEVILEVVTDPEAIDDRQLVAFIQTGLDPTEVLNRLDRFDEGWWLDASHRSHGKLCIHLE
jgi:hypothetical protein